MHTTIDDDDGDDGNEGVHPPTRAQKHIYISTHSYSCIYILYSSILEDA